MIKNKEKQFDCIKIKDSIQAQVYTETQNMSKEELLDYFNRNTQKHQPSVDSPKSRNCTVPFADSQTSHISHSKEKL